MNDSTTTAATLSPDNSSDKKPLGFWRLTSLVAGNMIGSGIFLLPDDLARIGAASFIAWGITILGTFCLALLFSRLSQIVQQNGGPYAYARDGLGNFTGFQTAYNHWIAIWVSNIALVVALIGYLATFFPLLLNPIYAVALAITILWLLTFINMTGMHRAGALQLCLTIIKLIPLIGIALIGFWYFNPAYIKEYFALPSYNYSHITGAASLTLWAFIGVESAAIPRSFVENPRRNIPLATFIGTATAAIVYIATATMLMGLMPQQTLGASPSSFVTAAEMLCGQWGKWIMLVGAAISCFGCMHGWIMLQGQVTLAAAEHKLFPRIFAFKNKHGIPSAGLIVTAILQTVILLTTLNKNAKEQFHIILLMASLAALIPYLYTAIAALPILQRESAEKKRCWDKVLLLIATLTVGYSFWSIAISEPKVILYGSILVLVSAILYGWWYGNRDEKDEESVTIQQPDENT